MRNDLVGAAKRPSQFASVGNPFAQLGSLESHAIHKAQYLFSRGEPFLGSRFAQAQQQVFENGNNRLDGSLAERAQDAFKRKQLIVKTQEEIIASIANEIINQSVSDMRYAPPLNQTFRLKQS